MQRLREHLLGGSFAMGQFVFGRLLAVATFLAFWSLFGQVEGLYGAHGILPIEDFLALATEWGRNSGNSPTWTFPSLIWLTGGADRTLRGLCLAGMVGSVVLFAGVVPRLAVACLWLLYLSFVALGQVFLGYQWDGLLLEALFVGFFFVPGGARPRRTARPETGGRWLVWLLCFKLMFSAGLVKLMAPNSAWTDLTALNFHFWTQPIPNSVAWYADQLPQWLKSAGVIFTLVAETIGPLLIFAPRRVRHAGALLMIALQLSIMATGTYGFFNVLSIALCAALFDDEFFGRAALVRSEEPPALGLRRKIWIGCIVVVMPLVALTSFLPRVIGGAIGPLRTFNGYGLFADMTRERPEISVEWSDDGERWTPYDFEYKPTTPDEPLRMTTLHMPRLDWQMWFAALGGCQRPAWLQPFAHRLLEGGPEVLGLLQGGFSPDPPRFVRMRFFQYRFARSATWKRDDGFVCARFTLDDTGALVAAYAR